MQNQSCFGGRLIVAPLVHLLLIPSTPMHLKLINNPLCYLTDQIIIREVQLKSCHTLKKKCSFNFFEQCISIQVKPMHPVAADCLCRSLQEDACFSRGENTGHIYVIPNRLGFHLRWDGQWVELLQSHCRKHELLWTDLTSVWDVVPHGKIPAGYLNVLSSVVQLRPQ